MGRKKKDENNIASLKKEQGGTITKMEGASGGFVLEYDSTKISKNDFFDKIGEKLINKSDKEIKSYIEGLSEKVADEYNDDTMVFDKVNYYINNLRIDGYSPTRKENKKEKNESDGLTSLTRFYHLNINNFPQENKNADYNYNYSDDEGGTPSNKEENDINDIVKKLEQYKKDNKPISIGGKSIEIDKLIEYQKALSDIVKICADSSVAWFNKIVEEAIVIDQYSHVFRQKASIIQQSHLSPYFWYKMPYYHDDNPISLSVFFNLNPDTEDDAIGNSDKPIIVAIELHDSKVENKMNSYFSDRINKIIELIKKEDEANQLNKDSKYKELEFLIYEGGGYGKKIDKKTIIEYNDLINLTPEKIKEYSKKCERIRAYYPVDHTKDIKSQINKGFKLLDDLCKTVSKISRVELELYKTIYLRDMKQMVLTGAPGTGKTYGAIEYVNNEVDRNRGRWEIVQFHPSYDYTDFVEGIRPVPNKNIENNLSFVKLDGDFKRFCRKIVKSRLDKILFDKDDIFSKILIPSIKEDETNRKEKKEDNNTTLFYDPESKDIYQFLTKDNRSCLSEKPNNNCSEKEKDELRKALFEYIKKIADTIKYQKENDEIKVTISENEKKLLEIFNSSVNTENEELFYFIIDEINRADISKVFGELMFGFEYRGVENRFPTQYSQLNVVFEKNDVTNQFECMDFDCFEDGFFIPENLIVIGTMNDIDKSVESFDFAMRRRFQWIPVETKEVMFEVLMGELCKNEDDQKRFYKRIAKLEEKINDMNEVITHKKWSAFGLNKDYRIGPSYFKNYHLEKMDDTETISREGINKASLGNEFELKIVPTLCEYVRGRGTVEKIDEFVNDCGVALGVRKGKSIITGDEVDSEGEWQ